MRIPWGKAMRPTRDSFFPRGAISTTLGADRQSLGPAVEAAQKAVAQAATD
jgi:hypothetical protein